MHAKGNTGAPKSARRVKLGVNLEDRMHPHPFERFEHAVRSFFQASSFVVHVRPQLTISSRDGGR